MPNSVKKIKQEAKILLVEDDEANVMVATACLDDLGYDYDVARNSQQAVSKFSEGDYGLILMDIRMPGRDGIETTKIIRSMEARGGVESVPIIALTAEGDKERCMEAGMDDYLLKPFTIKILKDKLLANVGS